ncbi:hypothetical protein A8B78_06020 [Jannaschia sp. EhC01]|nr:hypothetical protein A8B78_06020 [Jannaschia sp. EhC01]
MTFTESISTCFRKYATFSGRAARSEFWWFALFLAIVDLALSLVSEALSGVWNLATVLPYAAVAWRRLHDIDRTGLWALAPLVPMVVAFIGVASARSFEEFGPVFWVGVAGTVVLCIVNIVFWASRGTSGSNPYGEDPLA